MDINATKLNLIKWITEIDNVEMLDKLDGIRKSNTEPRNWNETLEDEKIDAIKTELKNSSSNLNNADSAKSTYDKLK